MCPPDNPLAGRGERHPVTPPEKCVHRVCQRDRERPCVSAWVRRPIVTPSRDPRVLGFLLGYILYK